MYFSYKNTQNKKRYFQMNFHYSLVKNLKKHSKYYTTMYSAYKQIALKNT
jgi:hypothetical protein